ncbi:MAG: translation initiation factor IF-5A [Candidatus Jordarchaeales archaeon]
MSKRITEVSKLKVNSFIVIDDEPCRIVDLATSKVGKHGSAKTRIVAIGLFDGSKKDIVLPSDSKVEVPVIEKRNGQVLSVMGDNVMLMDLETYQTFETPIPKEEEIASKIAEGVEVEYWDIMGRKKITRVKG